MKAWEIESEQEEHSLSLSQSSSPSQSDQEQTPIGKSTGSSIAGASLGVPLFRQPSNNQANIVSSKHKEHQSSLHDICFLGERQSQIKPENFHRQHHQYQQPQEQNPLDMVHYHFFYRNHGLFVSFVQIVLNAYLQPSPLRLELRSEGKSTELSIPAT